MEHGVTGNEHGLTRRIKSTDNLEKGDKRTPRRSRSPRRPTMEHATSRRRCNSTRNLTKGDQPEPSSSDDDLDFSLDSQAPNRRYPRASSHGLLKSGNDELPLQEYVTSGEDKHHHLSNIPRGRISGRTSSSKVGTKRSPKRSGDGCRGRPSEALTRALSVGNFFVRRCDSSEELAAANKPQSIAEPMDME
jgi:hypothetical protein